MVGLSRNGSWSQAPRTAPIFVNSINLSFYKSVPGFCTAHPCRSPDRGKPGSLRAMQRWGSPAPSPPPECSCRNPSPVRQYRDRLLVDEATVDDEHHSLLLVEILQHVTRLARARGGSVWMELLHVAARPRRHGPSHNGY